MYLPHTLKSDYWFSHGMEKNKCCLFFLLVRTYDADGTVRFFVYTERSRRNTVKALEEKIIAEGTVLPGNILKVGNFLNHRLDTAFLLEMGEEIARLYEGCGINKILTIETSGIAIAMGAAIPMGLPVVFAKKNKSQNVSGDVYCADVVSFTHGNTSKVIVEKKYLTENDKVLIVDDFLANGEALKGLIAICREAGAEIAGAAIAIEKGFQKGGSEIRSMGIRVESLAIVESMTDDSIVFAKQQ